MTTLGRRWVLAVAGVLTAILLLAMGAALRPLIPGSDAVGDRGITLSDAEIGFAQDMSTHHEQAVFMTQYLDKGSVDPVVALLAEQISANQIQEIGIMRGWLMLFDKPQTGQHPMAWMQQTTAHAMGHMASPAPAPPPMPGMASWDDLNRLHQLKGRDAEILFLQLMMRHHQGGIDMAHEAMPLLHSPVIKRITQGMINDQTQEFGYMGMLLQQRGAPMLPYP
ncbi:DUF305 domain-containing protein [Nocardia terpenica]|uniref:DUF305 domain-containing protein n=1 Tax=Nocardia terpenica TaxID=455432 RepID=A0A291RE36_9NOCA|nr:DUF305 domain-containing protein [Nocardia terpenica]ATL65595.1 DUF305 domain-containing protein [Nocardia terpenica]